MIFTEETIREELGIPPLTLVVVDRNDYVNEGGLQKVVVTDHKHKVSIAFGDTKAHGGARIKVKKGNPTFTNRNCAELYYDNSEILQKGDYKMDKYEMATAKAMLYRYEYPLKANSAGALDSKVLEDIVNKDYNLGNFYNDTKVLPVILPSGSIWLRDMGENEQPPTYTKDTSLEKVDYEDALPIQ